MHSIILKKSLALIFTSALLLTGSGPRSSATAQSGAGAQRAASARTAVSQLSTGSKARAEVTLLNGTKIRGYVRETASDSFTLVDSKTGASQRVAYADVARVKRSGGGLSTRTWAIIGGAVAAAVIVGIIVRPAVCDGGAQSRFPC